MFNKESIGARIFSALFGGFCFSLFGWFSSGVLISLFVCCFESNVFLGFFDVGPKLGFFSGIAGMLLGYHWTELTKLKASWENSNKFKTSVILAGFILLGALGYLLNVIIF